MADLTPHQQKGIDLLYASIEAMIALHNYNNPSAPITFEEVLKMINTKKI